MQQCLSGNFLDYGFYVRSVLRRKDVREMTSILSQCKLLKQSFIMRRIVRVGGTTSMLYYRGVGFTLLPLGGVLCTHRYGLYRRCTLNGVRIIDVLHCKKTHFKK